MPAVTADQVGKLYDILIATRDGSALPCPTLRPPGGQSVNLSQVAYMLSTAKPSSEATEIQRKDTLTQLASAQVIDREFDAWPQVEQGDWSDGQGQRVFSGQGEALGTVSNKSTRYWDGQGILWPVTDYIPKRGVLANPDQHEGGANIIGSIGTVSTSQALVNGPAPSVAFAYLYQQVTGAQNNILVFQFDNSSRALTNPPGTVAAQPPQADMIFFGGFLLWLAANGANVTLSRIDGGSPPVATTLVTINTASFVGQGLLAAGVVGNRKYVAFMWENNVSVQFNIRLIDVTNGSYTATVVDIPLDTVTASFLQVTWLQLDFLSGQLIVAGANDSGAFLLQYDVASQTWSTLAHFPHANNLAFCSIAGGLFVLSDYEARLSNGMPDLVDAWIVQAGAIQHLGPVDIQSTALGIGQGAYITGIGQPVAFGSYAIFSVVIFTNAATASYVIVMAYDILRGRWFKMNELGPYDPNASALRRMAISPPIQHHPFGAGTLPAQWAVAVPVPGVGPTNVQRLLMNVSSPGLTFSPLLQQGVQITSSLIDFTSGQNKLYRQLVADFTALPNDAAITVQLDCWFDQDPANLATVPDFTTGVVAGSGANVGLKQLKLVTNKIARKVVYRITTTGPSTTPTAAVKIISVKVQVATGWSLHYFLDISRTALCNDGQTHCFDNQVSGMDDLAAHSFLKQLWRLKGGECVVTLPDGQTYNALLQLLSAENLKHTAPSSRSDEPGLIHQVLLEIKVREDV